MNITYRTQILQSDNKSVRQIVESTGFFYDYEIPIAVELVEEALKKGQEISGYFFVFAELDGKTVSYTCFGPISCTVGSYDLYWIATHNDYRGKGIGKMILEKTHKIIKQMNGRMVIAETSSQEKYAPTRHFYISNNYTKDAQIKDFYDINDDKVMYVKRL